MLFEAFKAFVSFLSSFVLHQRNLTNVQCIRLCSPVILFDEPEMLFIVSFPKVKSGIKSPTWTDEHYVLTVNNTSTLFLA